VAEQWFFTDSIAARPHRHGCEASDKPIGFPQQRNLDRRSHADTRPM
jgi:hypothetical protein